MQPTKGESVTNGMLTQWLSSKLTGRIKSTKYHRDTLKLAEGTFIGLDPQ